MPSSAFQAASRLGVEHAELADRHRELHALDNHRVEYLLRVLLVGPAGAFAARRAAFWAESSTPSNSAASSSSGTSATVQREGGRGE